MCCPLVGVVSLFIKIFNVGVRRSLNVMLLIFFNWFTYLGCHLFIPLVNVDFYNSWRGGGNSQNQELEFWCLVHHRSPKDCLYPSQSWGVSLSRWKIMAAIVPWGLVAYNIQTEDEMMKFCWLSQQFNDFCRFSLMLSFFFFWWWWGVEGWVL